MNKFVNKKSNINYISTILTNIVALLTKRCSYRVYLRTFILYLAQISAYKQQNINYTNHIEHFSGNTERAVYMKLTENEYGVLAKRRSPNTKMYKTVPAAFAVGGIICCIGQLLTNIYRSVGIAETTAGTLTSVTLVFLSAVLTGFGLYDKIAKHAGAGTLVPITGFANAVVSPALEFKTEGYVLGVGAKIFIIAGPVIVYGLAASAVYGVILFIMQAS